MKKIMVSIIACFMMFVMCVSYVQPAFADGSAPVAENFEIKTYRNTSVGGLLSAYDPEEDVVSYEITTWPVKGKIVLEADGQFVYTPDEGKKGRDYFGYKALDSEGNVSQEATVIIRIEKKKAIEYEDMKDRAGEYAAVTLFRKGIFTGEKIGEVYNFAPDKDISYAEFINIISEICGEAAKESSLDKKDSESTITKPEAMKILNACLGLQDIEYMELTMDADEETVQACVNLSAVDVIKPTQIKEEKLDREAAAIMLVSALEIFPNR